MAKCKARGYCPVHNPSPKDKKNEADGKRLVKRVQAIRTRMDRTKSPARMRRALADFEKLMPEIKRLAPEVARVFRPLVHAAKKLTT